MEQFSIPSYFFTAGGKIGDYFSEKFGLPFPITTEMVERLLNSECYSSAKFFHAVGWQSKVNLLNGLREMIDVKTDW